MGGMIISQTASSYPDLVEKLVYVTAMLPDHDETIDQISIRSGTSLAKVQKLFDNHGLGIGHPAMGTQPLPPLNDPFQKSSRFETIPSYFMRCTNDTILPINIQDEMINKYTRTKVKDIISDHLPQKSVPDILARELLDII